MIREISLYSLNSKEAHIHPIEKILLSMLSLCICSYIENYYLIIFNIILFIILNYIANNPIKIINKFIVISFSFFIFTAITLIWQGYGYEYISLILLRSINGAITISYLALTTPINHIAYIISRYSWGIEIADIIKSMERFLILIEEDFSINFKAMKARGGFSGFKKSVKDFGKVCGLTFQNLIFRWREINISLKNRCYKGKHNYNYNFKSSKIIIFLIIMYPIIIYILYKISNR